ncbi:Signal recognition particle 14kD protein family protein [Cryptosporidium meleagridis]|uniref:Signal recognition particle 14kD protein family protein n=1 Tax=Cryptosporidium meleagridis TaxID=93969 RepID=A0A2P4Z3J4_9CRYT|nr:Signal recognition particle 14kD protein family protein [Cryptosporidium meleagridis]
MKEFDVSGFVNELNSILRDEKNKKPVRITMKRYCPEIKGCKRKRKAIEEEKIKNTTDKYYHLVRVTDGKKRKSRVVIKNEKDSNALVSELSKSLVKADIQKKVRK